MRTQKTLQRCFWLALAVAPISAQDFTIDGIPGQVHAFASQGFALSNQNNYLTMDTSQGSFDFRDAGVNASMQITDNLRVGVQAYDRKIGKLGSGQVTLDWALADYRFNDWIGIRAGKVKTVLGLYNDTQDFESLHTWAILPQSLYALDLRGLWIAHLGADIYGGIPLGKVGRLSYTAYAGRVSDSRSGGIAYALHSLELDASKISGLQYGGDLRWNTPLPGVLAGVSLAEHSIVVRGVNDAFGGYPYHANSPSSPLTVLYAQYSRGKWRLDAEYSRMTTSAVEYGVFGPQGPAAFPLTLRERGSYASIAYRISKSVEIGTYHSWYYPNANLPSPIYGPLPAPARHIYDQTATIRFDFKRYWDFKIEGHFIDGYGDPTSFEGFYPQDNPQGLKPKTDMLVLRLGFTL